MTTTTTFSVNNRMALRPPLAPLHYIAAPAPFFLRGNSFDDGSNTNDIFSHGAPLLIQARSELPNEGARSHPYAQVNTRARSYVVSLSLSGWYCH